MIDLNERSSLPSRPEAVMLGEALGYILEYLAHFVDGEVSFPTPPVCTVSVSAERFGMAIAVAYMELRMCCTPFSVTDREQNGVYRLCMTGNCQEPVTEQSKRTLETFTWLSRLSDKAGFDFFGREEDDLWQAVWDVPLFTPERLPVESGGEALRERMQGAARRGLRLHQRLYGHAAPEKLILP